MIQYFTALLVLLAFCASSQHTIRYVKPDNSSSSSCPGQLCLTLDQYASQQTKYFTTGTTFLFLAGNHGIETHIILNRTSDVALKAVDDDSKVIVLFNSVFVLVHIEGINFTVQGITFMLHTEVVQYTYQPGIIIIESKEVALINSTFFGNFSVQALYFKDSDIVITGCKFERISGGAIRALTSKLTLDRNIFEENAAYNFGGAVYAHRSDLTIIGNAFEDNTSGHAGGAMFINESKLIIEGNSFKESTATFGGALLLMDSDLIIEENVFEENVGHYGGAVFFLRSNATVQRNIFEGNFASVECGGAIDADTSNISMKRNNFKNNVAEYCGGALHAIGSSLTLDEIVFCRNTACLLGGAIYLDRSFLLFKDKLGGTFAHNFAKENGGAVYCAESSFFIESSVADSTQDSEVASNRLAGLIGGVISWHNNSVQIASEDKYKSSGGAIHLRYSAFSSNTKHLYFCENSADQGGAISTITSNLTLLSANFTKNTGAIHGGAILAMQSNLSFHNFSATGSYLSVFAAALCNVSFSGDINISRNYGGKCGGIEVIHSSVYFTGYSVFEGNNALYGSAICSEIKSTFSFSGTVLFIGNSADLDGGAVHAVGTTSIVMGGNVSFIANRAGRNGGAAYFENGAKLIMKQDLTLTLTNNHAAEYGGALFHEDSPSPEQCALKNYTNDFLDSLSVCFILFANQTSTTTFPYQITARNNSANYDGSFLFGGLLDTCDVVIIPPDSYGFKAAIVKFYPIFLKITNVQSNTTIAPAISSEPYQLCFCESDEVYSCTDDGIVTTYRGMEFSVFLLTLAQGDTVVSSLVRAKLSSTARLLPDQASQHVLRNCTSLAFTLYSSKEQEQLLLYPNEGPCFDTGLSQAVINVTFLPCPDGFTLSGDQCVCEERLQKYHANCTIFDSGFYITRDAKAAFWLYPLNDSNGSYRGLILYPTCPIQYCKTDSAVNITLFTPNIQCAHNRSRILCGACAGNYSLTFGSLTCETCSNTHLALLLVFAAAGVVLVVFLTFLRLTVATGTINSVILYANIVQTNKEKLLSNSSSFLQVFIAWTNLDFDFQACFYDGMDAYVQTWLQLAFPVYVWFLISLIILTSRYSMTVTKLIGSNPIAVLATLLLMSYTKLLKIIIEVYSSVDLEYPGNKQVTVWLKDANEPYLQSRHLALTVVTTLLLVFLFLPYTLLLLLGYKLYRFTGRKHTRWLMRIKPLLDTYYAPYKMHTRYWTGFLLLVRCALYIVFSYNSLGHMTQSLLAIIIAFAAIIAWLSVGIYSNLPTNAMEAVVYLNLIVLSASTALAGRLRIVADSLVGMVFVIVMGIVIYQFHIIYIAKWLKLRAKTTVLSAEPNEANLLLDPAASTTPPEEVPAASAAPPQREPTRSVVSIPK